MPGKETKIKNKTQMRNKLKPLIKMKKKKTEVKHEEGDKETLRTRVRVLTKPWGGSVAVPSQKY